jgi:putative transposase
MSISADALRRLRAAETIGRPLGEPGFVRRIERKTGLDLMPGKPAPEPKRRIRD